MEKLDVILWVLGGGFVLLGAMWKHINGQFDKVDGRFDKLEEKVTDIDRRLCRLEGAFSAKECCAVKYNSESRAV
jgi:hypothetical protein